MLVVDRKKKLKHDVLKNVKEDLNVVEKIEVNILSDLSVKIYRRGRVDEFNEINKTIP